VQPDRDDPDYRELMFQEAIEEARPSMIMTPPDLLPFQRPDDPMFEAYVARYREWKEKVIDARIWDYNCNIARREGRWPP
jgi:hypothetical protein